MSTPNKYTHTAQIRIPAPTAAQIQNAADAISAAGIDLSASFIEDVSKQIRFTIPAIREVAQIQGITMLDRKTR